jgi:hypothetical protein
MQARKKLARPEWDSTREESDSPGWGLLSALSRPELSRPELDMFDPGEFEPNRWTRLCLEATQGGQESSQVSPAACCRFG